MGIFKDALVRGLENAIISNISDKAFEKGQNAESPPVISSSYGAHRERIQDMANKSYEAGQRSVLVKIGNKIADKI